MTTPTTLPTTAKVTTMKKRPDLNIRFYGTTQHTKIKRAAKAEGISVNEFMVTAALERATKTRRVKKAS